MLDFASVAAQMEKMLDEGRIRPDALPLAVKAATSICARCDHRGDFNSLIEHARQTGRVPERWHPARLLEGGLLCGTKPAPEAPSPHLVVASDGSQIYPDAHQIADCYLLHISGIALRYGSAPLDKVQDKVTDSNTPFHSIPEGSPRMSTHAASEASLEAQDAQAQDNALMRATPHFGHGASDDAWQQAARLGGGATNREMVDARRHVAELDELAALLDSAPPQIPAVGLCDGIFDLRVSSQQPWRELAQQENHRALDALRQCGQPIGGFIARSRATDVVTALRVALREIARENPQAFESEKAREIDGQHNTRETADENRFEDENNGGNNGRSGLKNARVQPSPPAFGHPLSQIWERGTGDEGETRNENVFETACREESNRETQTHGDETRGANGDSSLSGREPGALFNREVDEALSILVDARLFDGLLRAGERSATFVADRGANRSGANQGKSNHSKGSDGDGDDSARGMSTHARGEGEGARHQTCFFYLKSGEGDVARVEFPIWVAQRADWLDRLHAVVLAQIERGAGYPVALMEAHEHAVVRSSERELFYQLLEEMMTARGLKPARSIKALSKSRPLV